MSSQASTIAFPQRRQFPEGLPAQIERDETTLDVTALAIANLAGESWDQMSTERCDEFRAWAMLAAVASHPEGLLLLSYSLGRAHHSVFKNAAPEGRLMRLAEADSLMAALRGTALRVSGVVPGQFHADVVAIMRQDAQPAPEPVKAHECSVQVFSDGRLRVRVTEFLTFPRGGTSAKVLLSATLLKAEGKPWWSEAQTHISDYVDAYPNIKVFVYQCDLGA